ncbi:TPM domain-containing protein [Bartonella sp. WD12.1]|uniref:TPM domain-containing protein n=1 Tax=Bartonella sp. WD12.1 TaxID=1933903 RepID=UPI0009D028BD|nr:hypothetical protein BWD121_006330 [Bartonella sp. WD12.1]
MAKKINNSVLLVVASNECKVCIEVGYSLEKELTDAISAVIINNFILSNFREENHQKRIIKAVNAITKVITGSDSDVMSRIKAKAKIVEMESKQTEKNDSEYYFLFNLFSSD